MIQIKRNNKVFFTLEDFGEGSKLSYQLMDHHYIILKFTTATPIYFEIGDSVEIPDFGYFELTSSYFPKHNDSDGYDYEMQMDAYYMSWKNKICKYRPQHGANETSFNLTTTVGVHMNVILGNLKALGLTYNGKEFSVDYTTYNNKAFDVQKRFLIEYGSISILDALNAICSEDALNCEWWIDGSIIYLGYCEMEGQTTFEQDVNVLSMSYSESKSTYITRLYAFGSDRNIPKGYFTGADADVTTDGVATDYLMLPNKEVDSDGFYAKDGYLENVNVVKNDKQAIEGVVMFEEEYPKVESVVSSIKTYDSTVDNEDGTKTTQTFWQVTSTDSFTNNFKESWIKSNLTLGIKFTSGALMGMEFDVSFKVIDNVNYFEIVANDTYGRTLPDGVMCPKVGDKYFLFNWDATKITDTDLIPTAQLSLFDRAKQYYQKTMISNSNFTCTMDGDKFYNDGTYDYHPLGEQVKLINDMFAQVDADGKHYRNSRIIGMEIPLDIPYDHPQYTVGEKAATSRLGKLEDKVDSIKVNGMQIGGTGSGNGGVYVIGLNDSTPASDSNVYSARRSRMEFIHRLTDDTAKGTVTWEKVQKFLEGLNIGEGNGTWSADGTLSLFKLLTNSFSSGPYGQGAQIDEKGDMEVNSIYARQFISAPKFVFNEISVTKAEQWNTNGYGTIESVDVKNRTITLHLEENDYGSLQVGDICRGLYADIENVYGSDKIEEGASDDCNFVQHKGFFSTYFYVSHIITSEKGKFVFQYGKKSSVTPDPCAYMDFAQYGSFTDEKRQSSMYFSSRGNSFIEVLDGVCTWEVQSQNRVARYGWLGGLTLVKKDGSTVRPEGNGIYVQDNIYFGGNINFLQGLSGLDDLREEAKAYDVSLSQYQSVITVDDMGNVINGLYTEDEEKTTKQYRISTAVFVRKGMDILLEEDGNTEDVTAGHYRVHAVSEDCEVMVQNSTIFVTAIRNIKDGVAGTNDDANFDYDAMRKATDAMVTIVVELEGKTSKLVQMPIRIQHDTLPFMVCDLSNESASVAWNTKTAKYIGLPIKTKVSLMYHNEPWAITSLNISKVAGLKTSMSIEGKAKVITIDADNLTADTLAQVTKMNITVVGRYAGANYEYTRELTILKSSDTVVYELIPSADSIVVDKDGNKTVNSVSCDVYATSSDDKRYKLTALPAGMSLKYGKGENATTAVALGAAVDVLEDDKMVTFALYDSGNNMLDKESVPVLAYGKDGKGIEYIFKLQNSAPSNPTPSGYATDTDYQRADYVPTTLGWTDDPTGVDAVNQYEWVSKRVSTNGHWGPFSAPAEYAHFGKHAPKAKSDDDIVTIPTDSKGKALVRFEESIQFQLLVDGLSCTLTSVTMDSSTLSDVSCSISSNVANISCAEGASLGTTAQTIVFRVAGRLSDGSSYSDYVTVKVVPNVTGSDGDGYEYVYFLSNSSTAPGKPSRSGGTLSGDWKDDPPSPTDNKRYVYVSYHKGVVGAPNVSSSEWSLPALWTYKAPKGQDGVDGVDGNDGKDGVGFVTAYQRAEKMPTSKPTAGTYTAYEQSTGDLGNSWLKAAPANISLKPGGSISGTVQYNQNLNGDAWTSGVSNGGYTWYQSPASMTNQDKKNGFCSMQVRFTTTVDDQYVTFYLKAFSEENWDFILLSRLDSATVSKDNCYSKASGNGKTVQVQMKCGKAGSHFVTVAYSKDGSNDKNGDYVLFRMATTENYVYVETLLYRCDGKVSPEKTISWGNIYQASGNNGEKGEKGDKGDPGDPGAAGGRGTRGPIPRTHNGMESGSYNYLQGADDEAYVDLVYRDGTWYRCIRTHTASTFISTYWESSQTKGWTFMATELLLAENARIDMMSSQEINLLSDATTLFGSFRWVKYNTDYAFWLGGETGAAATTSITKGGKLKSTSAEITGKITATSGQIGGFKLEDNNLVCSNARLVIGKEGNNFTRMVVLDAKSFTYASYNFALSVVNYGIVTQSSATQAGIHINVGASNASAQYPGIVMENGTFVGFRVPIVPLSYSLDLRNNASIYASGMCIRCNNSSSITITLPTSATGAKEGDVFTVIRAGTGDVTIKAPTGVNYYTASGRSGNFTSSKRYEHIQLVFDGDTWFSECSNDS